MQPEFSVNDQGIFYPAYLPLIYLKRLAYRFTELLVYPEYYAEVKVSQVSDGKGLSWEVVQFSGYEEVKDAPADLTRKYTFLLMPSWKIIGTQDHWLSHLTPRCEDYKAIEKLLQKIVRQTQLELKKEYKDSHYQPLLDKYLKNRNVTNILCVGRKSFGTQPAKDTRAKEIREFAKIKQDIRRYRKR